jgi:hypothetical protein
LVHRESQLGFLPIIKRSPHRFKGSIIKLRRGFSALTKETSRVEARRVAEELAQNICRKDAPALREFSFKTYAQRLVQKGQALADSGERNSNYIRTTKLFLDNDDWGLVRHFGTRDVRELTTRDWQLFIERIAKRRPDLSTSTRNTLTIAVGEIRDGLPGSYGAGKKKSGRPFLCKISPVK